MVAPVVLSTTLKLLLFYNVENRTKQARGWSAGTLPLLMVAPLQGG